MQLLANRSFKQNCAYCYILSKPLLEISGTSKGRIEGHSHFLYATASFFFPDILHVESSPVSHLVLYIISQKQLVEALELMLFSHYSVTAGISTKFPSFNPHLYLSLIKNKNK